MAFATIDVTKGITGSVPTANLPTIPVTKGGTGLTSGTTDQILKFTGSTTIASAAQAAGGKILNYKYITGTNTGVTMNSTSWVDSNITLTYTPSSTNSRLLVYVNAYINYLITGQGTGIGFKRVISGGATTTQLGDATVGFHYSYDIDAETNITLQHIDYPNTTSAVQYILNARREGGSGDAIRLGESNKRTEMQIFEISGSGQ